MQEAIDRLAAADAIIASTPVYKAGISGLFKSFADLIDNDLLIAKPVILAATGGTARHAMVVDEQLRPLFAFLRAIPIADLAVRRARGLGIAATSASGSPAPPPSSPCCCAAARPAISPTTTGPATSTSSPATRPGPSARVADVDFDSDLMRLAAGGGGEGAPPSRSSWRVRVVGGAEHDGADLDDGRMVLE